MSLHKGYKRSWVFDIIFIRASSCCTLLCTSGATELRQSVTSTVNWGTTTANAVNCWFARFAKEDTDFESKARSGRLQAVEDSAVIDTLKEDPETTTGVLRKKLGCTQTTVVSRLQAALGYRKVLTLSAPHTLTDSMRRFTCISICQSVLLRSPREDFLEHLVIGDESWVVCVSNAYRAVWIPRGEELPTQVKLNVNLKKVLLCCCEARKECCTMSCSRNGIRSPL